MTILKHAAEIKPGYPFRGKIEEVKGAGIWAIQMKDTSITEGVNLRHCVETQLTGKRQPDWLQEGDVLFAARGSNNYAVVIDSALHKNSMQAVAAPHFFVIRSHQPSLLPAFLAWQLNQSPCQRYFEQNAEGSFTKSIRRSVLENTPIAIPRLEKQQAIIKMANTLKREQQLIQQLIHNGETVMSAIANDLSKG